MNTLRTVSFFPLIAAFIIGQVAYWMCSSDRDRYHQRAERAEHELDNRERDYRTEQARNAQLEETIVELKSWVSNDDRDLASARAQLASDSTTMAKATTVIKQQVAMINVCGDLLMKKQQRVAPSCFTIDPYGRDIFGRTVPVHVAVTW